MPSSESITALVLLRDKVPPEGDAHVDQPLPRQGTWEKTTYRIPKSAMLALVAAVGSRRPLLVRGEPGVGKSDLARAAAAVLGRHFMSYVIQPYTEYQDLLWTFDHTLRLGEAQLRSRSDTGDLGSALAPERFITPGPLWWAFEPGEAHKPPCRTAYVPDEEIDGFPSANGVVLLIDEIDKADISLCNGLLEVLGNRGFSVPNLKRRVIADEARPPLVVITSNETRQLPSAFLRRCVQLDLSLPTEDNEFVAHLVEIGGVHVAGMDARVREDAARQILADRKRGGELARSGLAEYLDLLRVLDAIAPDTDGRLRWLGKLEGCFLKTARGR